MDFSTESQIQLDVQRIQTIINTGIFEPENLSHPLMQSAFTELMICLSDLLQKSKSAGVPVIFADDVGIAGNVTDLVATIRNAVCHIHSEAHKFSPHLIFSFNVAHGRTGYKIGDVEIMSDFPDDTAFFFGTLRIYFNHHVIRAFNEAKHNLSPFMRQPL